MPVKSLIAQYCTLGDSQWGGPALAGLRIVLIIIAAWVGITVLQRLVREVRILVVSRPIPPDIAGVRCAETVGRVVRYLIALVVNALAVMMVLAEIGISPAPGRRGRRRLCDRL